MNLLLVWLAFLVDLLVVAGFVGAAVLWAKRIGGAAPWLLAAVGVIDGAMICLFRLVFTIHPGSTFAEFERTLSLLSLLDAFSMYACGGLALVAFFLMMPKTPR